MKIPEQYNPVMPYLLLQDTAGFIDFAKKVFGAKEQLMAPGPDGSLWHGELRINDAVIMIAEAGAPYGRMPAGICLPVDNVDELYRQAMDNGATSLQEPSNRDYGRSAGFSDKWGNQWWLMNPIAHVV